MAYSNKFVANVIVDGRIQKELGNGTVKIPFGSEYTLRFRNKHNRRAVVQFLIDGEDVSGEGYVIQPHSKIEIRRHSEIDRAFRFVELDSEEAAEFGKDGPNHNKEKGLIECRFFLEKKRPTVVYRDRHIHHHYPRPPWWPYPHWDGTYTSWCSAQSMRGTTDVDPDLDLGSITCSGLGSTGGSSGSYTTCSTNFSNTSSADSLNFAGEVPSVEPRAGAIRGKGIAGRRSRRSILRSANLDNVPTDDGCTVEGRSTGQTFHSVYIDLETEYTTVKMFLQGYDPALVEDEPVVDKLPGTKKKSKVERENDKLRKKIAELENEKLKAKLADLEG